MDRYLDFLEFMVHQYLRDLDASLHDLQKNIFSRWWFQRFFPPLLKEMIQFDEHIYQMGGSTTTRVLVHPPTFQPLRWPEAWAILEFNYEGGRQPGIVPWARYGRHGWLDGFCFGKGPKVAWKSPGLFWGEGEEEVYQRKIDSTKKPR